MFGDEGVRKTKSCQFHFKQSLQRMLRRFPAELGKLRAEFEELMTTLLTVVTLKAYRELKHRIQEITSILPSLQGPTEWWFARQYNLFPIFRGYCISSVNLAEIGHSTLKRAKAIALVDTAWEDTCTMILQEQEHTAFLTGRKFSTGKGPGAGVVAEKLKRQQMKRAKEYQKAFQEKNFDLDDTDGMFIPQKKAKHRHPDLANFRVEGITQETERPTLGTSMDVDDSLFQDEEEGPRRRRDDSLVPDEQEAARKSNPLRPVQQMQYNFGTDNPPLLAFLHGFKITTCFGCKNKFGVNLKNPPEDLIVKMPVKRDRLINQKWVTGWKNSWGYFHLSVNCLKW